MTAREWLNENVDVVLLADGFDEALIGYAYSPGRGNIAVYDAQLCMEILLRHGMTEEEAEEFFSLNIDSAWVGEGTPVFLHRFPPE